MDKNTVLKSGFAVLVVVLLMIGYILKIDDRNDVKITEDEKKFKEEYESLNGKQREGRDYKNMDIKIEEDNNVIYASQKQILDLFEKGTGIIYFGFPDCPWCRNVAPVLVETAKEENVKNIYYYNAKEERDEKKKVDGKIEEVKKGSTFYIKILAKLGDKASKYDGLDDENIKRLYFPTVVFVKDGKILSMHEGSVGSQMDPFVKLNDKQKKELKEIFVDGMNAIYGSTCDDKC